MSFLGKTLEQIHVTLGRLNLSVGLELVEERRLSGLSHRMEKVKERKESELLPGVMLKDSGMRSLIPWLTISCWSRAAC